jgi:hypothetical protein
MKRLGNLLMFAVLVTPTALPVARVAAQQVSSEESAGTPAEKELIKMIDSLYQRYETHYTKAEAISDPAEKDTFYVEDDPAREAVPRILEFESRHQGTSAGLMALRRLVLLGAGSGRPDSPAACHGGVLPQSPPASGPRS